MHRAPIASLQHHSEIALLVGLARVGADEKKAHAAETLGFLALESKANREQIRQAGGISVLVALARVGTSEQKLHASSALATLGPEWLKLRTLCLEKRLGGNDLPDAWLAAAVLHHDEHLVSFDADFKQLLGRGQFTLLAAA